MVLSSVVVVAEELVADKARNRDAVADHSSAGGSHRVVRRAFDRRTRQFRAAVYAKPATIMLITMPIADHDMWLTQVRPTSSSPPRASFA